MRAATKRKIIDQAVRQWYGNYLAYKFPSDCVMLGQSKNSQIHLRRRRSQRLRR